MARFFFHLVNTTASARDEEGADLDNLDAARAQAVKGIRSVLSDEALRGVLDLRGRIEIADDRGKVLEIVEYREAIELHLDGDAA